MAKTKLRKPRMNGEENVNNWQNDLYTHSSPPKVVNGGSGTSKIREYIRTGNISALEEILLSGYGQSLVNQPSTDKSVRSFLKTVPSYMSKIDLVHDAAERGNLRDLKALLDRKKLARSKDKQGVGLLHKAVLFGHKSVVEYLVNEYPESVDVHDKDGRGPLHYAAASRKADEMYNYLSNKVDDSEEKDNLGKTASYYMQHPSELSGLRKETAKNSGGQKKRRSPNSKKNSPIHKTPTKREGLNITGANIRIWIHDEDLPKLEKIVWEGQGHRLMNETSNNPRVRQFLKLVPRLMTKIKEVHMAPISGDIEALETKVDNPDILIAKDHNGLNPLHRAAALGHYGVCKWIVGKNPLTVHGIDKNGRSPLHFATIPTDGGDIYQLLIKHGADPLLQDQFNRSPDDYRGRPGEIDKSIVYETPSAPRIGGSTGDYRMSKAGSNSTSRTTSPRNRSRDRTNRRRSEPNIKHRNNRKTSKKEKLKFIDLSGISEKEIDEIIQEGDLEKLEYIILSGKGHELKGKSSWNDDVRKFLRNAPAYSEKIFSLQDAANAANYSEVKKMLQENPKLAMGRTIDGEVALHFAAKSGSEDIATLLLETYPEGIYVQDRDSRLPSHWAAMSTEPGSQMIYNTLERAGADVYLRDVNDMSAKDYQKEMASSNGHSKSPQSSSTVEGKSLSPSLAASRTPSPAAADDPNDKKRSRSKSKSRGRSRSKSRSKSRSGRNSMKDSKESNRSRSKNKSSRNPSRKNSKDPSRSRSRRASRDASRSRKTSRDASKSRNKSRSRSKSRQSPSEALPAGINGVTKSRSNSPDREDSKDTSKPGSPQTSRPSSPAKSRSNSKERSRPSSRQSLRSNLNAEFDEESQKVIGDAENGNFNGLTMMLLSGAGNKLVGAKSDNDDVQHFLDEIPNYMNSLNNLQQAVKEGDMRTLKNELDKKEKAKVKDENGSNLLHLAIISGNSDVVRYLAENTPSLLEEGDNAGRTPMHYAAVMRDGGHLYKILQKAGGNSEAQDGSGYSPEDYIQNPEFLSQKDLMQELANGKPSNDEQSDNEQDY